MKILFTTLILLIAAFVGVYFNQYYPPIVFIYQNWSVEIPLWLIIAGVVTVLGVILIIYHLLASIYLNYQIAKNNAKYNKQQQGLTYLQTAFMQLIEGNNISAEKSAMKSAHLTNQPCLAYFTAAQAAHAQQAWQRRDNYLQLTLAADPSAALAITLNKTKLQLDANQIDACLATIAAAERKHGKYKINPNHPRLLETKYKLYLLTKKINKLRALLPKIKALTTKSWTHSFMRKKRQLSTDELARLTALEQNTYQELFRHTANNNDYAALKTVWETMPKKMRRENASLLIAYIKSLIQLNAHTNAELMARQFIVRLKADTQQHGFYNQLLELYGLIHSDNIPKQITFAENLLTNDPDNHVLLLALARLCIKHKLWGKARNYLQASVKIAPSIAGYTTLASLLETLGDSEQSHEYYKQGLLAVTKADVPQE